MSIRDLIMVFEVHIKEEVHSISYQTKLKPMCLVYTANYKHAYCMYKNIQLHYTYVCVHNNKKTCVNKDFTVTVVGKVVSLKFLSWPERGRGSQIEQIQEICRGQGSE